MAASGSSTYNDSAFGFIDISKYFSGSTVTSESYRCYNRLLMYKSEKPRVPSKVLHNVKTKVQPFRLKPSSKVRHIKQFMKHILKLEIQRSD